MLLLLNPVTLGEHLQRVAAEPIIYSRPFGARVASLRQPVSWVTAFQNKTKKIKPGPNPLSCVHNSRHGCAFAGNSGLMPFVRLHRKLSAVDVLWSAPASVDVSVCVCKLGCLCWSRPLALCVWGGVSGLAELTSGLPWRQQEWLPEFLAHPAIHYRAGSNWKQEGGSQEGQYNSLFILFFLWFY